MSASATIVLQVSHKIQRHAVPFDNYAAISNDYEVAASPTDERLTDKGAEDSIDAGLHHKNMQSNVVVESDGPESDRPETTASMGM